jgi:hypothetical protein
MIKRTQTTETNDDNNCTVMALKSVTGWPEIKCQTILEKAGRVPNKGFDIIGHLSKCKGKIEDVKFTEIADCRYYKYNNTTTLKNFATHRKKGAYYIVTNTHALAIIDGIIVDNLSGREASDRREVKHAYKVTGSIKPNVGIVTKSDTLPKKRLPILNYGEKVIYLGKPIKYNDIILAKKGDLITIETQQVNRLVVVKFYHSVNKYTLTAKIDRELLQTTKERERAGFGDKINHIK